MTCKSAKKWYLMSMCNSWLCPFNPFAPGDFAEKHVLKLAEWVVFWSLSCYKELKRTTNRFTGRTLRGLLFQMQNISLRSSGMHRKQNFEIIKKFLCLFFVLKWFNVRHFEYSCKRCSLNDWKHSAQRLKLQERLLTINKRNIIRWHIYRDKNFHSGRQVLKCL